MSEHTLIIKHHGYSECSYNLECSNPSECNDVYIEGEWPDDTTCRCTDPKDGCRAGDHGDCSEYGWFIDELTYACRCVPVEGCGLVDWIDNLGSEALHDWKPPLEMRVSVGVEWDGGYPSFTLRREAGDE